MASFEERLDSWNEGDADQLIWELRNENARLRQETASLKESIRFNQRSHGGLEQLNSALWSKNTEREKSLSDLQGQCDKLRLHNEHLKAQNKKLTTTRQADEDMYREMCKRVNDKTVETENMKGEVVTIQRELASCQAELRLSLLNLNETKMQKANIEAMFKKISAECDRKDDKIESLEKSIVAKTRDNENLSERISSFKLSLELAQGSIGRLQEDNHALQNHLAEAQSAHRSLVASSTKESAELKDQVRGLEAAIKLLRDHGSPPPCDSPRSEHCKCPCHEGDIEGDRHSSSQECLLSKRPSSLLSTASSTIPSKETKGKYAPLKSILKNKDSSSIPKNEISSVKGSSSTIPPQADHLYHLAQDSSLPDLIEKNTQLENELLEMRSLLSHTEHDLAVSYETQASLESQVARLRSDMDSMKSRFAAEKESLFLEKGKLLDELNEVIDKMAASKEQIMKRNIALEKQNALLQAHLAQAPAHPTSMLHSIEEEENPNDQTYTVNTLALVPSSTPLGHGLFGSMNGGYKIGPSLHENQSNIFDHVNHAKFASGKQAENFVKLVAFTFQMIASFRTELTSMKEAQGAVLSSVLSRVASLELSSSAFQKAPELHKTKLLENELSGLRETMATREAELQAVLAQRGILTQQLAERCADLEVTLARATSQKLSAEDSLRVLQLRYEAFQTTNSSSKATLRALEGDLVALQKEHQMALSEVSKLSAERLKTNGELASLKAQLGEMSEIDRTKSQMIATQTERICDLMNEVMKAEGRAKEMQEQQSTQVRLVEEAADMTKQLTHMKQQHATLLGAERDRCSSLELSLQRERDEKIELQQSLTLMHEHMVSELANRERASQLRTQASMLALKNQISSANVILNKQVAMYGPKP